jgi:hypothetical protein
MTRRRRTAAAWLQCRRRTGEAGVARAMQGGGATSGGVTGCGATAAGGCAWAADSDGVEGVRVQAAAEARGRAGNESERKVVSGQESNMTCGPRRFSYRRLNRCLGFERRLIASV